jgi:hypothetical protein
MAHGKARLVQNRFGRQDDEYVSTGDRSEDRTYLLMLTLLSSTNDAADRRQRVQSGPASTETNRLGLSHTGPVGQSRIRPTCFFYFFM